MKNLLVLGFAVSVFSLPSLAADQGAIGFGLDSAGGTIGEHLTGEVAVHPGITLGLDLAKRDYKAMKNDLSVISGNEESAFVRFSHPVTTNVAVYQKIAGGMTQLPDDATVTGYNFWDAETGVSLTTGMVYTSFGVNLRANDISEPLRVGTHVVASKFSIFPTVAVGINI